MKILFRTLLLSAVITLASCEKDKTSGTEPDSTENNGTNGTGGNNNPSLSSTIVGSWEMTSFEQKDGKITYNGTPYATFSTVGKDFKGTLDFKNDGSTVGNLGYTFTMTTAMTGLPAQTQTSTIPQTATSGTYQVVSNTEIKTNGVDGTTIDVTVSDMTASTMTWTFPVTQSTTQAGITSTTSCDVVMKLKKK